MVRLENIGEVVFSFKLLVFSTKTKTDSFQLTAIARMCGTLGLVSYQPTCGCLTE